MDFILNLILMRNVALYFKNGQFTLLRNMFQIIIPFAFHGNVYPLSLDEWIRNYKLTNQFSTVLYMDTGKGYNEEEKSNSFCFIVRSYFFGTIYFTKTIESQSVKMGSYRKCRMQMRNYRM